MSSCGRCGGDLYHDENGQITHTQEECDATNRAGNFGCVIFILGVLLFLAWCGGCIDFLDFPHVRINPNAPGR